MVVTVEQHQIATAQQGVGHDFIGSRSPVQHEIGFIGVEHLGGVFLGVTRRAFVD
ncbi:hypothetical protein D3C81_2189400 [compost metagenome]